MRCNDAGNKREKKGHRGQDGKKVEMGCKSVSLRGMERGEMGCNVAEHRSMFKTV